MKKITPANFQKDKLYPSVTSAFSAILSRAQVVTTLEVLLKMGWLTLQQEKDWRQGRIVYLERVLGANLCKLSRVLRIIRIHAAKRGLKERQAVYKHKSKLLRFSKTGDANIEDAYSRHYLLITQPKQETVPMDVPEPVKDKHPLVIHEGGCLCGEIRYRATGAPENVVVCHCEHCRRAVGAPMVAWADFSVEHFAFSRGEPKLYKSSPELVRTFCGQCGTSLSNQAAQQADTISVSTATFDLSIKPKCHIHTSEKLNWVVTGGKVKCYRSGEV